MELTSQKLAQIMRELRIDVPVYRVRTVGERVELTLSRGRVITWQESKIYRGEATPQQEADKNSHRQAQLRSGAPFARVSSSNRGQP